ncbi:nucleotidyl transferase AbiEii/AbiGii toxin family protein [Cupriavidus sp. IDO]|uniref:nucleotidyl transferase AbiEii/AbiGii toxin family protein n=1 Tax=Cupriavidus sp. IDO TaxID=1539142 RepID=UPI000A649E07|nr:nucleotidyl transferase AbiEii/AbiGii toxin family protein [Cupriavidus sp. IDO]
MGLLDVEAAVRPAAPGRSGPCLQRGHIAIKAFGAIRRFSEDIDLSFDRADLGYSGDRDPETEGISRKQANQLIKDLVGDVEHHIAERLLPALRAVIVAQLGEPNQGQWSLEIDANDAQTVNSHYPIALHAPEYQGMAYITPRVKLELGARGDPWPTERRVIHPYAAEDYPDFFDEPDCTVTVLSAQRTFWEKATALHAEAHRPAGSPTPQYFSRHYYDLAMLLETPEGKAAAKDLGLFAQVVTHKATFFRSSWSRYDIARPGTLKLIPNAVRIKDLHGDYRAMAPMMFDENPPSFEDVLARIEQLERTING